MSRFSDTAKEIAKDIGYTIAVSAACVAGYFILKGLFMLLLLLIWLGLAPGLIAFANKPKS